MKSIFLRIAIICSTIVSAVKAENAAQVQIQMSNADPKVRASAMEQFVESIDPSSQPKAVVDALPILVEGMNDTDPKVRENAVAGLLMIASATMRIELPANPKLPDLATSPKVQQALLNAMSDSDCFVRCSAIKTYALTYKLTPELEQKIIDTFNSYKSMPGQPDDRFELLGSLVNDGSPSPIAVKFIVQKIDEPQFGITAIRSLGSLKKPPTDVLPRLLGDAGRHDVSKERKSALKQAVKAYGPSAQARLDQILANPR